MFFLTRNLKGTSPSPKIIVSKLCSPKVLEGLTSLYIVWDVTGKRERRFSLSKCEYKTQAFWQCVQNWILNDIAGKLTLNLRRNIKIFMEKEIQIFTCPSNAIMVWSFELRGLYAIDSLYDYNLTAAAAACF